MAQRRQKPTLESRQPLAFLPAPTVLGHPTSSAGRFRTERGLPARPSHNQQRRQQPHAYATIGKISLSVDPFFFECRQLSFTWSAEINKSCEQVMSRSTSLNLAGPCRTKLRVQTLRSGQVLMNRMVHSDRDVKRDTSQETPMKTLQLLRGQPPNSWRTCS